MKGVSVLPSEVDGHIETALPWYVNGTLPEAELAEVELHLSECAQCRASHHLEVLLQQQLHTPYDALQSAESGWAALAGRLDAPTNAVQIAQREPMARGAPARRRVQRRLVSLLLIAQAGAIAALAFALIHVLNVENRALYRTFTDAPTQIDAAIPTLRVVFADDVTSARIRALLSEVHGSISAGPGKNNVYTVQLTQATPTPAGRSHAAAEWLRSQAGVLLAEPVNFPAPD